MDQPSSWKVTAIIAVAVLGALGLYAATSSAEREGWAAPSEGVMAAATIERADRSDGCGVTARHSRCYRLTLNIEAPIAGRRELDVNIADALFHRFDSGQSTRAIVLPDGRIALDRTLLE